jgi:hypothetical protein
LEKQVQLLERANDEMRSRISGLQSKFHLLQESIKKQKQKAQRQRQQIKDQQEQNERMQEVVAAVEEEKKTLQSRVRELSDQLDSAKITAQSSRKKAATLERQVQTLKQDALGAEARCAALNSAYNDNFRQFSQKSATTNMLNDRNNTLQKCLRYLDEAFASAKREAAKHGKKSFDDHNRKKAHDGVASKLKLKEVFLKLSSDLTALETENTSLRQSFNKLQEEACVFRAVQPLTLRYLLVVRLVEASFAQPSTDMTEANELQMWWPNGLCAGQLDKICSTATLGDMVTILPRGPRYNCFYGCLELASCEVCYGQKFKFKLGTRFNDASLRWLHEFTGRSSYFSCCYEKVCRDCFLQHTIDALEYRWWCSLGSLRWFVCPRSGCGNALGIRCEADLQICLERNGDTEIEKHVQM